MIFECLLFNVDEAQPIVFLACGQQAVGSCGGAEHRHDQPLEVSLPEYVPARLFAVEVSYESVFAKEIDSPLAVRGEVCHTIAGYLRRYLEVYVAKCAAVDYVNTFFRADPDVSGHIIVIDCIDGVTLEGFVFLVEDYKTLAVEAVQSIVGCNPEKAVAILGYVRHEVVRKSVANTQPVGDAALRHATERNRKQKYEQKYRPHERRQDCVRTKIRITVKSIQQPLKIVHSS